MANTFSYRPKNYSVVQLKKIAQQHHVNLNRYIEEAIVEKVLHEKSHALKEPAEQLAIKITKIVVEHMGLKLSKPDAAAHVKINKKFNETTKSKKWVDDADARPLKFRKTTPQEHRGMMEQVKQIKSGQLKEVRVRPIKLGDK